MKRKRSLVLIGAGQIGSRHLQAMSLSANEWVVYVVDPILNSLELSRKRWLEVKTKMNNVEVSFSHSLLSNLKHVDVAIIATDAAHRLTALLNLLTTCTPTHLILEKVLFQSLAEIEEAKYLLKNQNIKTYVNCPRRMYPFYSTMQTLLAKESYVNMTVKGTNWDMACNGIHHLDLWCYLTGEINIEINASHLLSKLISGKRNNTQEIFGSLTAKNNLSNLTMSSEQDTLTRQYTIKISSPNYEIEIDEPNRMIHTFRCPDDKKLPKQLTVLFQSQLTHLVVDNMIDTGQCELTDLNDSATIHQHFLISLLGHFQSIDPTIQKCPIT
ncbi:MAG: Gfo/Idh/MocA family oxidoreductase [Paraglaciecola sp.]|uniref:Gfo/Idh/MocA family oxidoreductase n=1 Tax=Paraglaciecola sp. TaxID=1920173 RepID=UPI003263214B